MATLKLELIPEPLWYRNARAALSKSDWDKIRKKVYAAADHQCEICGAKGKLHCHEVWHYDEAAAKATLFELEAVCENCHLAKHMGYANIQGKAAEALSHLMKVNGWSELQAETHIREAYAIWNRRNKVRNWQVEMPILGVLLAQF